VQVITLSVCRQQSDLQRLKQLPAAAVVIVSGNPIARELKIAQIERSTHSERDTKDCKACSTDTYASAQLTTAAEKGSDQLLELADTNLHATVLIHAPQATKPSLGKSFCQGSLNVVAEHEPRPANGPRFEHMTHERILAVFDRLNGEIDNWRHLATIVEASVEGDRSDIDKESTVRPQPPSESTKYLQVSLTWAFACTHAV
jgi:hypothetical protein